MKPEKRLAKLKVIISFEELYKMHIDDWILVAKIEKESFAGVMMSKIQTVDIGEWDDEHKFNLLSTPVEEYEKEFEGI